MLYLILLGLVYACQTANDSDSKLLYKKQMVLTINGVEGKGAFVVDASKTSKFTIQGYFREKPDYLRLTTCHRYEQWESLGKKFKYQYNQVKHIEGKNLCYMELGSFDKSGQNNWAMIDFKNNGENLKAVLACGGEIKTRFGASICQGKENFKQSIWFEEPVKVYVSNVTEVDEYFQSSEKCEGPTTKDNKLFLYNVQKGKCRFTFANKTDIHRHTVFGYEEILRGR